MDSNVFPPAGVLSEAARGKAIARKVSHQKSLT
jgi:hypothetical protein